MPIAIGTISCYRSLPAGAMARATAGRYFECIDKASEIEDVEDVKRMEGMAVGIYERLLNEKNLCAGK
jgi:hypothetical protein